MIAQHGHSISQCLTYIIVSALQRLVCVLLMCVEEVLDC
jgi:hypothetical protein